MNKKIEGPDVGQRLAAARLQRGLTQAELAVAAGIAPAYLSRVENGRIQPTFGRVVHLLDVLGADLAELAGPERSARRQGPCPVTERGRCLIDLIGAERDDEHYTPREVRQIRRFALWLKRVPAARARAMEVLLDDLLAAAGVDASAG